MTDSSELLREEEHEEKIAKAPEGLLEDETVFITAQRSRAGLEGGRIQVTDSDNASIGSFPIAQVTTMNLFGLVGVTTPLVHHCSEIGITINYFTHYGKYLGSFVPVKNTIALVRRHQSSLTKEKGLSIAKEIIRAKIHNSRVFLARKKVQVPQNMKSIEHMALAANRMDGLRAIEGEAAGLYFSLLSGCLGEGWTFTKRTRRPPRDEFNALLSLTYTMMLNEVISALRQYNLDPFLGVMHVDRHGRPALALDLLEEFRPVFCDAFVVRLVNRKMIQKDEFTQECHLTEPSFKKYLGFYNAYMQEELAHPRFSYSVSRRKVIQIQAILLRKAICGELKEYHPFMYSR